MLSVAMRKCDRVGQLRKGVAMSTAETLLASLLDEQAASSRRFVIEAVPDNSEVVKVTLLTPGVRLTCKAGVILPARAIKSIKKTGDVVSCCGKALQAVELTFSDEKALSYDDIFSAIRDVHSSVTNNLAQSLRLLTPSGNPSSFLARQPSGTAGGEAQRPMEVGGSYGECMVNAMLRGPHGGRAFAIWMDTWANICEAFYG
jgi:hypothetical protein